MSGAARCWACSTRKRRSRGPFSPIHPRTGREQGVRPVADRVDHTFSPAASPQGSNRYKSSGSIHQQSAFFGESSNGGRNTAVCDPSEPSTKPFTPPTRSQSSPRPPRRRIPSARPRHADAPSPRAARSVNARTQRVRVPARANVASSSQVPMLRTEVTPFRRRLSCGDSASRIPSGLGGTSFRPATSRCLSGPRRAPRRGRRSPRRRVFSLAGDPCGFQCGAVRQPHMAVETVDPHGMVRCDGVDPRGATAVRHPKGCGPSRRLRSRFLPAPSQQTHRYGARTLCASPRRAAAPTPDGSRRPRSEHACR